MAHWNARAGIKECKRMADAGSITNLMVCWKVKARHFLVAAIWNHSSSHTLFQNGPLKRQGWHQGMQKDGRCWLNHQFHSGLKGWSQPFVWWQLGGIGTKMKECKEMVCPSSLSMSSHGTGPGSLSEVVPPPEASLIKWSMAVDKNNLDHGCTAKTWTNLDRFHLQP
jgi:hypothetical protein